MSVCYGGRSGKVEQCLSERLVEHKQGKFGERRSAQKRFSCWLQSKVDQTDPMHGILRSLEAWPEKVNLSGSCFDTDPGKNMPNDQNMAALKHKRKPLLKRNLPDSPWKR